MSFWQKISSNYVRRIGATEYGIFEAYAPGCPWLGLADWRRLALDPVWEGFIQEWVTADSTVWDIGTGLGQFAFAAALKAADHEQRQLRSETERAEALSALLDRAELQRDVLRLIVRLAPLVPSEATLADAAPPTITRDLPLGIKRRGVEMRLVIGEATASHAKADPVLLKEIARGYRCFDAVLTGKAGSMAELATRESIDERYVRRVLPLAFLAPEIVQAVVMGAHPVDLTAKKLIRRTTLPLDWRMQKQVLGFR